MGLYRSSVLTSLISWARPMSSAAAKGSPLFLRIGPVSQLRGLSTATTRAVSLSSGGLNISTFSNVTRPSISVQIDGPQAGLTRLFCSATHPKPTANGREPLRSDEDVEDAAPRYSWVDHEAHGLIEKAYARHKALADKSKSFPPSLSVTDLERIGTPYHYPPRDFIDRVALNVMKVLRVFVHAFFREKYDHHAVCLETVAAVPGLVGSFHRHLRSLRRMQRDYGWITVLQEEAENERMHLLIFMKVCQPTRLERAVVLTAQGLYLTFYSTLYLLNSRAAHRLTGYLEEEAHRAYTDYLASLDAGKIENKPAPVIARHYYHLPDDATMRDVVLHVRADEAMHRDVNHEFGNMYAAGQTDRPLHSGPVDRT